ncbi:MAG: hypothetical protein NWE93_11300 [Candidatus Bathyarchaeota archaeon]|nr:hypothetical protein [Candidatus Bathyarchaeota archaeon]
MSEASNSNTLTYFLTLRATPQTFKQINKAIADSDTYLLNLEVKNQGQIETELNETLLIKEKHLEYVKENRKHEKATQKLNEDWQRYLDTYHKHEEKSETYPQTNCSVAAPTNSSKWKLERESP